MGFGKDGKGIIIRETDTITLSTLLNGAFIKQNNPLAITNDFRIIKSEYVMGFTAHTAGEVPIDVYLINDDLSAADVAGAITIDGPLGKADRDKAEAAMRFVKLLGTLQQQAVGHLLGPQNQHGVVEIIPRWTFALGVGWAVGAFNNSGATLTTGTEVRFSAKHYGVWV